MSLGWLIAIGAVVGLGGIALLLFMYGVGVFNQLVTLRNRVDNAFAQIEVQLKRRHDLIPNLVEIAKGYMAHERDTLEAVIKARNAAVTGLQGAAGNPGDEGAMTAMMTAEKGLSGAMGRLFALAEAYPDLKANQNMIQLTEELTSTENKISFARQGYNDSVTSYNTYKQTFPPVLVANFTGHGQDRKHLEFDSQAIAEAPKVSFNK
ncbi:MAG: LemA family protein [Planctomycetaceae bacterium]|nr:LemA family protein [Planctomycetaceae bacterium]